MACMQEHGDRSGLSGHDQTNIEAKISRVGVVLLCMPYIDYLVNCNGLTNENLLGMRGHSPFL